MTTARCNLNT